MICIQDFELAVVFGHLVQARAPYCRTWHITTMVMEIVYIRSALLCGWWFPSYRLRHPARFVNIIKRGASAIQQFCRFPTRHEDDAVERWCRPKLSGAYTDQTMDAVGTALHWSQRGEFTWSSRSTWMETLDEKANQAASRCSVNQQSSVPMRGIPIGLR